MRELDVNQAVIKDNQAKLSPIAHAVRLSIVGLGLAHGASQAATIEVTSNLDDNGTDCTLRQAIVSLNEADLQGGCLIDSGSFGASDSIMFSNSLPNNSINLIGQYDNYYSPLNILSGRDISIGASNIDGGITVVAGSFDPSNPTGFYTSRIFEVEYATLRLDNITVTGANTFQDGAAIWLSHSTFSMNNSIVSGNTTTGRNQTGGGIFAENSTLSLINSAVSSNGGGVGLFVTGSSISLINSTISDNFREGLSVTDSDVEIINSTFSTKELNFYSSNVTVRNSRFSSSKLYVKQSSSLNLVMSTVSGVFASDLSVVNVIDSTVSGNGFELFNSTLGLSNSTVSNTSVFEGGFVFAFSSTVNIHNSTATNTTASFNGGSIWAIDTSFNLSNSIIANSYVVRAAEDNQLYLNGGSFVSDSVSIVEGGGGLGGSRDFDPGLLPLANNGGPTQTHALAPDSIARDAGIFGTCTLRDQRGRKRDGGDGLCDVGAFESIKDSDFTRSDNNEFLPPIYLLLLDDDQGN